MSIVLVAYGNFSSFIGAGLPGQVSPLLAFGHATFVVVAILWARKRADLTWKDLGLRTSGWLRAALVGIAVGGGLAGFVAAALAIAHAIGWQSRTASGSMVASGGLLVVGLRVLVVTAICEELWFRGVVYAGWARLSGPLAGLFIQAGWFAAWHLAVWTWTLGQVSLQAPIPVVAIYPGGLLALGIAGLLFGVIRQRMDHLAGPIAAHWMIVVGLSALVLNGRL